MSSTVSADPGFGAAVELAVPVMTSLAGRLLPAADRDDLVQDAVLVAWRRQHTYGASRGSVQNWLLVLVLDQARKRRRRSWPEPRAELPVTAHNDGHVDFDLERAIAALPERQRVAVTLRYFCDLPIVDVAAAMQCPEGTAKSLLSRGRRTLADTLGEAL